MQSSQIHVLVVDDEPVLCELTREFLEMSEDMKVGIACSVKEAKEALSKDRYDIIVSDYQMPEEDGIQFLQWLRSTGHNLPFILLTGKGREEVIIEALNSGADAYLQKGGDPRSLYADLEHRIRAIIRRYRAEAALKDSEMEYHSLFEDNPDPIIVISVDGTILNCNHAALGMGMVSRDEVIGCPMSDLKIYTPEDLALFKRTLAAKSRGESVSPITSQVHRKDGSTRWVEIRSSIIGKTNLPMTYQIIARDITKRKNAEESLRESEKKYRLLVDSASEAIFVLQDGIVRMTNRMAVKIIEYAEEDISSRPFLDFVHPDDRAMVSSCYNKRLHGENMPDRYDFRFLTRDGKTKWVSISAMVIEWDGRIATLNLLTDITDRKKAEEALRESEIKYRSVVERAAEAILVLQDETFQLVNPMATEVTGFSEVELLTMSFKLLIHPDDLVLVEGRYRSRISGKETPNRYSFRLISKDGSVKWALINAIRIDWKGRPATLNLLTDITDLKRTENELRETQAKLHTAMDLAKLGAWEYDVATDTFIFDEQFYAIYGTTPEKEGGMKMVSSEYVKRFITPADAAIVKIDTDAALVTKDPNFSRHLQQDITGRDGERRTISIIIRVIMDPAGRTIKIYGVNQDVTEIVHAQVKLRDINVKLNLLSGITRHDIKNQLMVLMGNLSLLKNGKLDQLSSERLCRAEASAERISTMIQFTKEYEDIGMQAANWHDVRGLITLAARGLQLDKIRVVNDVPDGTEVMADPMIRKVFHNLVDNAIRHGGNVTTIRFSIEESGVSRSIICEDDGVGISAKDKGTIFTNGPDAEHGFGLFLSREILNITDITISEEGRPGHGAKFVMTVPANGFRVSRK
jgi:PAS domain S-box-containing protein